MKNKALHSDFLKSKNAQYEEEHKFYLNLHSIIPKVRNFMNRENPENYKSLKTLRLFHLDPSQNYIENSTIHFKIIQLLSESLIRFCSE